MGHYFKLKFTEKCKIVTIEQMDLMLIREDFTFRKYQIEILDQKSICIPLIWSNIGYRINVGVCLFVF